MNVLAMVTGAFGAQGGIAQFNRFFLEALCENEGIQKVTVFTREGGAKDESPLLKLSQQGPHSNPFIFSFHVIKHLLRLERYDLIFCGHIYLVPLALLLKKVFRVPFWLHIHGIEAWEKRSNFVRKAAEEALLVTSVSRYTRQQFMKWANVSPDRIKILPDTYNPEFKPGEKAVSLVNKYGLENKKVLLTVGRLSSKERYKGHDLILEALPQILQEIPDLVYLIVGDGDDKERLMKKTEDLSMKRHVVFISGLNHEDLREIYRLADLFTMPSTGEGFGIVYLEAAASGIPVLCGNSDGSVDAIREGYLGQATELTNISDVAISSLKGQTIRGAELTKRTHETFGFPLFREHLDRLLNTLQKKK